jgi:hypothetical protein
MTPTRSLLVPQRIAFLLLKVWGKKLNCPKHQIIGHQRPHKAAGEPELAAIDNPGKWDICTPTGPNFFQKQKKTSRRGSTSITPYQLEQCLFQLMTEVTGKWLAGISILKMDE